ncbi:hypothetical protein HanHA89_Chr10g0397941 [Helianthus annuus]|nr:hypothetical protein HanHA89_Chr10g0397941 [Helianthus annuus]
MKEEKRLATGACRWTRGRGQSSVQAINRGAWFTSKASLGKPLLSHFATTPPPLQHQHPPP